MRRLLCSQRRRRAWHSTHRHTNRHWVRRHGRVNDVWRLSRQCHAVTCETHRHDGQLSRTDQRSNSVCPSTSLGHSQMSASQSRTRIGDRIGVHLDAETAIIMRDSSRHSRTLTDELVGKEEASPDCRVHRPIQQERQNRCVPIRSTSGAPWTSWRARAAGRHPLPFSSLGRELARLQQRVFPRSEVEHLRRFDRVTHHVVHLFFPTVMNLCWAHVASLFLWSCISFRICPPHNFLLLVHLHLTSCVSPDPFFASALSNIFVCCTVSPNLLSSLFSSVFRFGPLNHVPFLPTKTLPNDLPRSTPSQPEAMFD